MLQLKVIWGEGKEVGEGGGGGGGGGLRLGGEGGDERIGWGREGKNCRNKFLK